MARRKRSGYGATPEQHRVLAKATTSAAKRAVANGDCYGAMILLGEAHVHQRDAGGSTSSRAFKLVRNYVNAHCVVRRRN